MSPTEQKYLCVSIHDVAPQTWPDCQHLLRAIRAVADIPVTFLIVPQYHESQLRSLSYENMLEGLLEQGHELALHGYTHLDTGPARGGLGNRFMRSVYTQKEGEFAAIDAAQASRRLALGLAWFRQRHWPVTGFIAPAWLLGEGAWSALRKFPFEYTTTMSRFHLLPQGPSLLSPSLLYTARNAIGRSASPRWASMLAIFLKTAPLVRLSLHPRDAHYPALVRHVQQMMEKCLMEREAMTKSSFARMWRQCQEESVVPKRKSWQSRL